jgi:uncharacterized protein
MRKAQLQRYIRHIVDQIVTLTHPRRVILFGSAASGRIREGSDLDFLVVVPRDAQTEELTDRLNMGIRSRPMPCDFMVVSEPVLNKNRNNPGLIYGEILSEGREVYAA